MLTVHELSLVLFLGILITLRLGSIELGEVTLVVIETLRVLMDNVGRDGIEERTVVRSIQSAKLDWSK